MQAQLPLAERRDGFRFSGGHPALDLTATLAGRLKPQPRELLKTPEDLGRWLTVSGLAASAPDVSVLELDLARALREAIYGMALSRIDGTIDPACRSVLNLVASGRAATPVLDADGAIRLEGPAASLITSLAHEAIRLFGAGDQDRIRQCASDSCALLFLDNSRAGDRRWCSMASCGNKAKVAEFRRRKKLAAQA